MMGVGVFPGFSLFPLAFVEIRALHNHVNRWELKFAYATA